jgi:hypothetical protein
MRKYLLLIPVLGLLSACQQVQQQPEPQNSLADPVPTALAVTNSPEPIITLKEAIDFSAVNPAGQGPAGSLIRWGNATSPGRWRSFTYDSRGRLIGVVQENYGQRTTEIARYQGSFLAESYIQGARTENSQEQRIYTIKRYQYDANGRLSRTLLYEGYNDRPNVFQLWTWLDFTYDAQGKLLELRRQSKDLDKFYAKYYWQNGDCVRRDQYLIVGEGKPDELQERVNFLYEAQVDPLSTLPLYDEYSITPSTHYVAQTTTYEVRNGVFKLQLGCNFVREYGYDRQNRLSQMRYSAGNLWDLFTYAP